MLPITNFVSPSLFDTRPSCFWLESFKTAFSLIIVLMPNCSDNPSVSQGSGFCAIIATLIGLPLAALLSLKVPP